MDTTRTETVLASAARTATVSSERKVNTRFRGIHVIIDVSALVDTPSVVPSIEALDEVSGEWYTLLTGVAITTTGTTVLKIHPSIAAIVNAAATDGLPKYWRVTMTHADTDSITYSVGANYIT